MKTSTIGKRAATVFLAGLALAGFPAGASSAERTLQVHGSTIAVDSLMTPNKATLEAAVGLPLSIKANGSPKGLVDVASGRARAGLISAPLSDIRETLEHRSPGLLGDADLRSFPIGAERAFFIVHRNNPVRSLTADQIREIFTGRITNWEDVGGPNMLILVYATKAGDDSRISIEKNFLDGEPITNTARTVKGAKKLVQTVRHRPDAISFGNAATLDGRVRPFPDVQVDQPLFLVTRGEPTADVRRLLDGIMALGTGF